MVQGPAGIAEQQQLLQELLLLAKLLLLQEVPLPLGCSNLTCLNLAGMSEVALAHNPCSGCKVARYCSRECQVAHWEQHRGLCKQLQKGKGKDQQEQHLQGVEEEEQPQKQQDQGLTEDAAGRGGARTGLAGPHEAAAGAGSSPLRPLVPTI